MFGLCEFSPKGVEATCCLMDSHGHVKECEASLRSNNATECQSADIPQFVLASGVHSTQQR